MNSVIYDMAQAYKDEFGFNAVPLRLLIEDGKKRPQFFGDWRRYQSDYYNKEFPDNANALAIVTGKSFNLTVIDIDAGFDRFVELYGKECCSYYVRTVSGGAHLYFLYDERISQGQWKDGIIVEGVKLDIRNDGGIVFAPPTAGYTFAIPLNACKLKPVPEKFVKDFLKAKGGHGKTRTNVQKCPVPSSPLSEICQRLLDGKDEAALELTPNAIYNEFGCQVMPDDIPEGMGNSYMAKMNAKLNADAGVSDEMHEEVLYKLDTMWKHPMGREVIYNTYIKQRDKGFLGSIKDSYCPSEEVEVGSLELDKCFYNVAKKLFTIMYEGTFKLLETTTMDALLVRHYAEDGDMKAAISKAKQRVIDLKVNAQFDSFTAYRDPFIVESTLQLHDGKVTYAIAGSGIKAPSVTTKSPRFEEIVADYKDHFPKLDTVLDFICACRFTEDRKNSYLYTRVDADWGKSYFNTILNRIGLGFSTTEKALITGTGIQKEDLLNAMVLSIDEFKHFGFEMKDITNQIILTPKYQLQVTVPVYAKMFFSAEKSTSFFGSGADEQLRSRVTVLDIKDGKKIFQRDVYLKDSTAYRNDCTLYIYEYMKAKIDWYVSLGAHDASVAGSIFLRGFKDAVEGMDIANMNEHLKESITETLTEAFNEIHKLSVDSSSYKMQAISMLSPTIKALLPHLLVKDGIDYIQKRSLNKIFEICIGELDGQTRKKSMYKTGDIESFIVTSTKIVNTRGLKDFRGEEYRKDVVTVLLPKVEVLPFWAE